MLELITERLRLRPYTVEDLPSLHALLSDPVTMSFWPSPFTEEQSEQWLRRAIDAYANGLGRLAVTLRETGEPIGDAGLFFLEIDGQPEYDLGYIISSRHWNRGYGYEAAEAIMRYGFDELKLNRICANMPVVHAASRNVAEKLGMVLEKEFANRRNRNIRTCLYAKHSGS